MPVRVSVATGWLRCSLSTGDVSSLQQIYGNIIGHGINTSPLPGQDSAAAGYQIAVISQPSNNIVHAPVFWFRFACAHQTCHVHAAATPWYHCRRPSAPEQKTVIVSRNSAWPDPGTRANTPHRDILGPFRTVLGTKNFTISYSLRLQHYYAKFLNSGGKPDL